MNLVQKLSSKVKMFFIHRNSLITLKRVIRCCSNSAKTPERLLNPQIVSSGYKPKNVENKTDIQSTSNTGLSGSKKFSMIFPPPNVTGNIHLGHALTATIQDIIIRWQQKQNGAETLWIPGTDHAGIATQVVVEKILFKKFGKTRHEIGREAFLKEVWKWKDEKESKIADDLKKLGTSFNWDKEYFTMDPNLCDSVNEAFVQLFDKGLIYRDVSLVNWSCSLESAISDVEVDNIEISEKTEIAVPNYDKNVTFGVINNIAYKVMDSDEEVIVSTTRPETLLGDVAVAVHPDDSRYSHLSGALLWHPYRNEAIPLICDESVNPEFGTGAVKITPAHDKNDFEVGKRHKLRHVQVITEKGCIDNRFDGFAGLPRFTAREKILNSLAELQLYRGSKPHKMVLPVCSRSKDIIEFLLRPQWFVKCEEMSRRAVEVVQSGELKINPPTFEKEWFRWLTNCHDWCISRQLWWGHQIPAYKITTSDKKEIWIAAKTSEEAETKFKKNHANSELVKIERDQDVLDTWFSSGLLPFSVFNWPEPNEDFKKFFPLSLLETGHDILFFWVARMVMLSLELTNKIPFKEVLLHGIICDSYGRKMSKSLGNVLSPDHVINGATLSELQRETRAMVEQGILSQAELEKSLDGQKKMFEFGIKECGVDAMRFTFCTYNIKQHFISFDVHDCNANKNFFNKIHNAVKYAVGSAENAKVVIKDIKNFDGLVLSDIDRWLLSRMGKMVKNVKHTMNNYNFHFATTSLKTFLYGEICNVYIEATKINRMKNNQESITNSIVLNACLGVGIDYMEPFTPFLAREYKQFVATNTTFVPEDFIDEAVEKRIYELLEVCESIRELKSHCRITSKIPAEINILIKSPDHESFLRNHSEVVRALTFSNNLSMTINPEDFQVDDYLASSTAGHLCSFGINTMTKSEKVDVALNQKKMWNLEKDLASLLKVVNNEGYQKNASEKVQKKHQERIAKIKTEMENIREVL